MKIGIVIRTYNEERYLAELLDSINQQDIGLHSLEIIVVDSGSTDSTLEILSKYKIKLVRIKKSEFTFGRSLNIGCKNSTADLLIFISGHCIPKNIFWIKELIKPFTNPNIAYTYSRQITKDSSKFSETVLLEKLFPSTAQKKHSDFFCNNASACIRKDVWKKYRFNENLTGLEDLDLAKRIYDDGLLIDYCDKSIVYHLHNETWGQIRNRYERESYALKEIFPKISFSFFEFITLFLYSIFFDLFLSISRKKFKFIKLFMEIILFRFNQYHGTYRGIRIDKNLTKKYKEKYFYPK